MMSSDSLGLLFGELSDLRGQLEGLVEQLEQLTLRVSTLEQQPRVAVNNTNTFEDRAAPGEASSASQSSAASPEAPLPKGRPSFYVRKYYVVAAGTSQPGIFITYSSFAEQVRDKRVPWNGRGKLPFLPGVDTLSFTEVQAAEAWYHEKTGIPTDRPVPFWY